VRFQRRSIILMQQYIFTEVNNFQKIIETPLENQENYIAIAKIMKAIICSI
jgi:hypothetical protein